MSPNRPPRVPGFSYIGLYAYFVTICTARRQAWFQDPDSATWLTEHILRISQQERFAVIAYCVMPDHVHLLLQARADDADLRAAIHDFKRRTGFAWKRRKGQCLWQEGFHDYVLRDEDSLAGLVRYVVNNPIRARLVEDVTKYPYVGSSRYQIEELVDVAVDWRPPWKMCRRRGGF